MSFSHEHAHKRITAYSARILAAKHLQWVWALLVVCPCLGHAHVATRSMLQTHQGDPLTLLIKTKSFLLVPPPWPVTIVSTSPPVTAPHSHHTPYRSASEVSLPSVHTPSLSSLSPPLSLSGSGPSQVHLPRPRSPFRHRSHVTSHATFPDPTSQSGSHLCSMKLWWGGPVS